MPGKLHFKSFRQSLALVTQNQRHLSYSGSQITNDVPLLPDTPA